MNLYFFFLKLKNRYTQIIVAHVIGIKCTISLLILKIFKKTTLFRVFKIKMQVTNFLKIKI